MRLTAAEVRTKTRRGTHGDGRGLYLRVHHNGSKSWMLRATVDGRRREIGIGGYPDVSLAQARKIAAEHRAAIAEGRDPVAERRRPKTPTFRDAAHEVHAFNLPRWRSAKHAADWMATLERHAMPALGDMRLDKIDERDVLAVLKPIWTARPETARRVRQRIRAVMKWAKAHRFIKDNPAGEVIDGALPAMPKVKAHLRALPYTEVAAALETVEASRASMSAKACLRFAVMTAARSQQARLATWAEIDLDGREWRVPADRMKSNREHRVPLSDAALDVLETMMPLRDSSDLVFPSPARPRNPLSDMTLTKVLRDTGLAERTTVHGFRSTFRDWASETTNAPHAVMELSLAHTVGAAVEQAYARSDLLAKRRALMDDWAAHCCTPVEPVEPVTDPGNVVALDFGRRAS